MLIAAIGKRREMLSGHDQKMDRSCRINIVKGDDLLVLVDHCGRNSTCGNLAKNAAIHVLAPIHHYFYRCLANHSLNPEKNAG
jgi:hypothetical protein